VGAELSWTRRERSTLLSLGAPGRLVRGHSARSLGVAQHDENHLQMTLFARCLQLARPLRCYAGKDRRQLHPETHMNTLSSKFTALAAAVVVNSLIMGAVGFLFELQSQPQLRVASSARAVVAHQWLI
jgi:hypothetical protein